LDQTSLRAPAASVKPLHVKDPIADDVLRRQQRFHETLLKPHLRFHIRTFAPTRALARLLASAVAESAFENGSSELLDSVSGEPHFELAAKARQDLLIVPAPALQARLEGRTAQLYQDLAELGGLAPVEELASAFRLPIASHGSPCCIRKNTDPPHENREDMIVLGFEETPDGTYAA
ncbi:MAG TPA: hypothetical protein VM285_16940, partial [Polyangia bacterium]|nr:hypothetical protein [Polyangia bacterium]